MSQSTSIPIQTEGLSWTKFEKKLRGRVVLITNVDHDMRLPWTRSSFLDEFGQQRIKTNNGYFDHLRTKDIVTVREYLESNVSTSNIFLAEHAYGLHQDVERVLRSLPAPQLLGGFQARPILSLGVLASTTRFHKHAETWQYLLAGRKAWWLSSNEDVVLSGRGRDPLAWAGNFDRKGLRVDNFVSE